MTDHDADLDAILAQLGRPIALAGDDDAGAVLDALLDGEPPDMGRVVDSDPWRPSLAV